MKIQATLKIVEKDGRNIDVTLTPPVLELRSHPIWDDHVVFRVTNSLGEDLQPAYAVHSAELAKALMSTTGWIVNNKPRV